jgi:hypothetical protein
MFFSTSVGNYEWGHRRQCRNMQPQEVKMIFPDFSSVVSCIVVCFWQLLQSVAGCPISVPMTIVMSGISKMFVGELVETGIPTFRNTILEYLGTHHLMYS